MSVCVCVCVCVCAGEVTAAIDYYTRGVAALEEGIQCDVHAQGEHTSVCSDTVTSLTVGEEKEKAERLKEKMISNLEMARDRVDVLCECVNVCVCVCV